MKYNPQKKALVIPTKDVENVYYCILNALKHQRIIANLPLTPYEKSGPLTNHDYAAISVLELADSLGLDLSVTPHNHNKLDFAQYP